jgi:hypothetical protein
MAFDYPEAIGSLNSEQRLRFYEVFAHNLTVCTRVIWSDENISDAEKVDRIKWVNEILHRITNKVGVLRLNLHEWTESDTWEMIQFSIEQNKNISGDIGWAIKSSYESIVNNAGRV